MTSYRVLCAALLGLLVVSAVWVLGPSVSSVAQERPKEDRPKAAPLQKWEYRDLRLRTDDEMQDLNALGEKGWEVVALEVTGQNGRFSRAILKRPKP